MSDIFPKFEGTARPIEVGIVQTQETIVPCNCIGPQNGQPVCPCKMRSLKVIDGRYVQVIDYGPAPVPTGGLCLFDGLPLDVKTTGIACPCPKCSPR